MLWEGKSDAVNDVFQYIDQNTNRYVAQLQQLVRQPSITPNVEDCIACAHVLADIMTSAGCLPELIPPAPGAPPIIYFEAKASQEGVRSLLGYAHYDVKPVEPIAEWRHEPWGGEVVDGVMYGRGVVDNKSGCLAFLYAVEAFRAVKGTPPVNVKLVFEGEEETGSEHLEQWALKHQGLLEGIDGLHCLDGTVEASTNLPRINLHGRGMIYVELSVRGPRVDVHSGRANLVQNPAWRLVGALATIKDAHTDRILIDAWYDDLHEMEPDEEAYLRDQFSSFDEAKVQAQFGTEGRRFPGNKRGFDLLAAYHREPTANISGIHGGFTALGEMQTIVPSEAYAKLDFRCPPDLDTTKLLQLLRDHLNSRGYADVEVEVLHAGGYPWRTPYQAAITLACIRASDEIFGEMPRYHGPSAPEGIFAHHFGIPPILTGFGSSASNIHAPNEQLPVAQFIKGIKYAASIMAHFAEV